MSSYRIQTNIIDRSQVAIADSSVVGAMVVKGTKGPKKPVFIQKGDTDRLINIFGAPGVSPTAIYNDVWEAIQYNNEASMWICSPYDTANDKHGGVMVTQYGSVALATGLLDAGLETPDFSGSFQNTYRETVATADGVTTTFNYTSKNASVATVTNSNFFLYINGVQQTLTIGAGFTIACAGVLSGTSSTYTVATKALSLVFATAPAAGTKIEIKYTSPVATTTANYFLVTSKSPYAVDDLSIKASYNSTVKHWTLSIYKTINSSLVLIKDYVISFTMGAKDGFGKSVYFEDVLDGDDYIQVKYNSNATSVINTNGFVNDASTVGFAGGSRALPSNITDAMLCTAWDNFKSKRTYPADIFISVHPGVTIVQKFDELRNGYQIYSKYILPLPQANTPSQAIATKAGYSVNNRGLRFYWNWGLVRTVYGSFWTPLTGRVGVKHAQMKDVFFGKAPAWVDEDGHGGQLGPGVVQMAFDPTEGDLESLDTNGINPIVFDTSYGVMILSQKTAQNPSVISDTSYIGHSDVIDYIFENITSQVLTTQNCKLNDPYHREAVKTRTYQITNPVVQSAVLQDCIHKCDEGNNTPDVMAQRKFILTTAIKVTPFSERIVFNLIATEQSVSLSQVLS